ncbi:MAG: hypothetical protein ACJAQT_001570 [Akkermansiaceae bacterium]|jgi:hypothetical protein
MSREDKRAEGNWQQGEFLWRAGEIYESKPSLPATFLSLPTAAGNRVTISNQ